MKKETRRAYYLKNREQILAQKASERRSEGAKEQHRLSHHPLYRTWQQIKERCLNPRCELYPRYGGRGISVAPEWEKDPAAFIRFILEVLGPKPSVRHSLDRIDNDGPYAPGNVRWATYEVQNRNRRRTAFTGKVTSESARAIREELKEGASRSSVAAKYGISCSHVWRIEHPDQTLL